MGAVSFGHKILAPSAGEAFERLVNEAIQSYGNSRYNGTISTCSIGRCKMSFNTYSKENETAAREYARNHGYGDKWVADYIDIGVKHYVIREVSVTPRNCDVKYKMQYAVCSDGAVIRPIKQHVFDTFAEALQDAKQQALAGIDDVDIRKMHIQQSGTAVKAEVNLTETVVEKKPSRLKKGQVAIPMHVYFFYGWAAD